MWICTATVYGSKELRNALQNAFAVPEHLICLSTEACKGCEDATQVSMMAGLYACYQDMFSESDREVLRSELL